MVTTRARRISPRLSDMKIARGKDGPGPGPNEIRGEGIFLQFLGVRNSRSLASNRVQRLNRILRAPNKQWEDDPGAGTRPRIPSQA